MDSSKILFKLTSYSKHISREHTHKTFKTNSNYKHQWKGGPRESRQEGGVPRENNKQQTTKTGREDRGSPVHRLLTCALPLTRGASLLQNAKQKQHKHPKQHAQNIQNKQTNKQQLQTANSNTHLRSACPPLAMGKHVLSGVLQEFA